MTGESTVGELITTLIDYRGKTPPKTASGVPLITAKVIKGGIILAEPREYVAEDSYDAWMRRGLPASGDILITTEAPLGEVARVGEDARIALAQRVILLRPDSSKVDPSFMFHYLRSPQAQAALGRRSSGTTVSGIRQPELRALEVPLIERSAQQAVGAILDWIDDLIENSRRRVEVLEEMVRAIYREWFVDFRYPGHGDTPMVDSVLGPIPKGWAVATAGDTFQVVLGGTPSRKRADYWENGTVPWIGSARVNDLRVLRPTELITDEALRNSNAVMMPRRTTLLAITGATLGQVSALEIEACANQSVVGVFDPSGVMSEYIYLWFSANIGSVISHASGSAQQHINKGTVESTRMLLPSPVTADQFHRKANPVFDLIGVLLRQTASLEHQRNLLLPKLVTGSLNISTLGLDALLAENVT